MNIIGICDGPDAGGAYIKDGKIIAAINDLLCRLKPTVSCWGSDS